jgi:hypothetical protein
VSCVGFGLATDHIYALLNISAKAMVGQTTEFIPHFVEWVGALLLILLSIKPVYRKLKSLIKGKKHFHVFPAKKPNSKIAKVNDTREECSGPT